MAKEYPTTFGNKKTGTREYLGVYYGRVPGYPSNSPVPLYPGGVRCVRKIVYTLVVLKWVCERQNIVLKWVSWIFCPKYRY